MDIFLWTILQTLWIFRAVTEILIFIQRTFSQGRERRQCCSMRCRIPYTCIIRLPFPTYILPTFYLSTNLSYCVVMSYLAKLDNRKAENRNNYLLNQTCIFLCRIQIILTSYMTLSLHIAMHIHEYILHTSNYAIACTIYIYYNKYIIPYQLNYIIFFTHIHIYFYTYI